MSTRTIGVVLLAVICGFSAAILAIHWRGRLGAVSSDETVPVVTAAVDVARGAVLDETMLKLSRYPKQDVPKGALSAIDDAVGRTVIVSLVTSEPLVATKLADKGAGRGLAAMIPAGMRAFTIDTAHVAADVGGFLRNGNHVDVLLTTTPTGSDDATGGGVTTTLLQNVPVLAAGPKLDEPEDNQLTSNEVKSVTLLVTPDQATKLDLGLNRGLLHLALRNPGDDREASTRPAMMNDLRFHQDKPLNFADLLHGLAGGLARSGSGGTPKSKVEQTSYAEIRTLRGLDAGSVRIAVPR